MSTIMVDRNDMIEDLHVMQLSDSFFPTGLFATSNGIEILFHDKKISTASHLLEFNKMIIQNQVGPTDCVILANVWDYSADSNFEKILETDKICCSLRTNRENRKASIRSGNQLIRCAKEFLNNDKILDWYDDSLHKKETAGTYPVSFGVCCNALKISKQKTLMMFLYGFVVSNIGAALRLGMIQHLEGQKIIHQLKPLIIDTSLQILDTPISEIWQFTPQAEIFQMQHETMDSKMFNT